MKILFMLLPIIMAICAITLLLHVSNVPYTQIAAYRLEDKPEKFFAITDADPALLEAISKPAERVRVNALDDIQIDNLINQYMTNNLEYQNNYYRIDIAMVDNVSPVTVLVIPALIGLVVSTILLIALIGLKVVSLFQKKAMKQQ